MKRCCLLSLFTLLCLGCRAPVWGLTECSFVSSRRWTLSRSLGLRSSPWRSAHSSPTKGHLSMHMGHSHSHDHFIPPSSSNTANSVGSFEQFMSTVQEFQPRQFIFRRRRLVAMIVFLAGAILGPPLKQQTLGRSEWTIFGVAVAAVTAAEPLRNAVWQWIQRLRSLQQGIANHSAPITASYLFANKNAADRVTLLGGCMNIVLSVAKLGVGITCHSTALVADAGHSLSDLFSDIVTLWAVHVARLPPDQDHPYGHGKFEAIGALFLSLTLIVTALTVGMASNAKLLQLLAQSRSSTAGTLAMEFTTPSLPALAMAIISIVSKEWLFRVTRNVGQQLQSTVVIANAWHHRSDAYSSVLAAASIGLAMYVPGFVFADASAGLFVAAMIGMTGMEILGESVLQLTDTAVTATMDHDDHDHNHGHANDQELTTALTPTVASIPVEPAPLIPVVIAAVHGAEGAARVEDRVRNDILTSYGHLIDVRSLTVAASAASRSMDNASTNTVTSTRWTITLLIQLRPDLNETIALDTAKTTARDIRRQLESSTDLPIDMVHISLDLNDE